VTDGAADLVADDRELGHRRVDDPPAQVGVALEHEPEHGHGYQQQREQRQEPVIGEQRRPVAGLVLPVLLGHRHREGQPPLPLLPVVGGPQPALELFHRRFLYPCDPSIDPILT